MTNPTLRVGVGDYDHTRDLVRCGAAVDAEWVFVRSPEELFERFLDAGEFTAAEFSLALTTLLLARGDDRFVPIPAFPARAFRHSAIYVHADGPTAPAELAGATIGVPVWAQTAGVYVRGLLASRYGVDLAGIRWIQAGVDAPGRREPLAIDYGGYDVTAAPTRTLDDLLVRREVDAVISARPPHAFVVGDARVRRLFAEPEVEEAAWARETGIFPIMHVVVIRREAVDRVPHLPVALLAAFEAAKQRSLARAAAATVPGLPLPWSAAHARQARALLGEDWWPYGVARNRATLEPFLAWAADQRLTSHRLSPDDLFPTDALEPPAE